MRAAFVNIAPVSIGGKQPTEAFVLPVLDDGQTPAALYWRKRLAEGAIALKSQTPPGDASEVKPAKKGK